MAKLRQQRAELSRARLSPRTQRAYDADFRHFADWCGEIGRSPLPACTETLALYVTHRLSEGAKTTSAERYITSIAAKHRQAGHRLDTEEAYGLVTNAKRTRDERPQGKRALTVEQIQAIVKAMSGSTAQLIRDRAVILLGFASSLRRSEIAALDLEDVSFSPRGALIHVRRGKTDQTARGRKVGIFRSRRRTCPVAAIERWIKARGKQPGPLFARLDNQARAQKGSRIKGQAICKIVQEAVERIGLEPANYGAHSLRAGHVTAALSRGTPALVVMRSTGHRSVATLARYDREANALAVDPLAKAL